MKRKCRHRIQPKSFGADKGYAAGEVIHNVINENIQSHALMVKYAAHNFIGMYPKEDFQFDPGKDICICPEAKEKRNWGLNKHNRQYVYRARTKDCTICPKKQECTKDRARSGSFYVYEEALNKSSQLNKTKEYRLSQKMRKRIEELFGEANEYMGLRVAKFRRMKFVREQVFMPDSAQNIKKRVKFLAAKGPKKEAVAGTPEIQLVLTIIFKISQPSYSIIQTKI